MRGNITLEKLETIAEFSPVVDRMLRRLCCKNYDEFVSLLYEEIDDSIAIIERNRELRQRKSITEDLLSSEIVNSLKKVGYEATHESKSGGHVDILVEDQYRNIWLGEAKIHSSYEILNQGFLQLCSRYSTATSVANRGGIIMYIYNQKSADVVTKWREFLQEKKLAGYSDRDCKRRPEFSFYSEHTHDVSGRPYHIRHIAVSLYFNPVDKSGISTKQGRQSY